MKGFIGGINLPIQTGLNHKDWSIKTGLFAVFSGLGLVRSCFFPVFSGLGPVQSQSFSSLETGPSNTNKY